MTALLEWTVPYAWGRLVFTRVHAQFLYQCLAACAAVAAALAIVEFATGTNIFVLVSWPNSLYSAWHALQPRGGFVRVEGAFGHSIALGSTLAMCAPFVLAMRRATWVQVAVLALMTTAITLSFSRIALVSLASESR